MANETVYSNFITLANAVSELMGPAFVNGAQFLPLVVKEVFPSNSNTVKVPIAGTLIAETVSEAANYSYSSNSVLTDTSVTVTAKKAVVGNKLTVEADRFGKPWASVERVAHEMGTAIARLFDSDLKTLFSSTTNAVTATSTATTNNIVDCRYQIESSMLAGFSGKLVGALHPKAVSELRKDLINSPAEAFGNMEMLGILGMPVPGNGYVGNILGVDVYQCTGLSTSTTYNVQQIWDPSAAWYAGIDGVNGMRSSIDEPKAGNTISYGMLGWTFYKIAQWRDTAACRLLTAS